MTLSKAVRLSAKLLTRIIERILAGVLALVSLVVPRSRRIWAFGSWYGQRFADNPKYFFLHCASNERHSVRAVWLSGSPVVVQRIRALGFEAYHRMSPRGLWYALRAGVYIVDCRVMDVSPIAASGAVKVNLWHGVPLKKIERDIVQSNNALAQANRGPLPLRLANKMLRPQLSERYDYILATSRTTRERFASAFATPESRIITAGYPRTDVLLRQDDGAQFRMPEEQRIIEECRAHAAAGRRVLFYMPTFRDWRNDADRQIPIDWDALDALLRTHGGVLYCKLHPNDQASLPDLTAFDRISLIPSSVDPYPVLRFTDALISDYSSIFFDYLLLDNPVLFYPYDLEDYQRYSRALYDRYEDVTPGPKARTARELESLVVQLLTGYAAMQREWRPAREQVRALAHEFRDDGASARLHALLCQRLGLRAA